MRRFIQKAAENRWLINLYPPFLGAGIRLHERAEDWSTLVVTMPLRWWNKNYVGVHFGGSLYSMTDPWFMLMAMKLLGPQYVVWDKAASIRFIKPGRERVWARFAIEEATLAKIRQEVAGNGKSTPTLSVPITDAEGNVVAEVKKTLSIRMKQA